MSRNPTILLEVRSSPSSKPLVAVARVPRQHAGWQSVAYAGKRYQVFGGIHGQPFIDLSHCIRPGRAIGAGCTMSRVAFVPSQLDPCGTYTATGYSLGKPYDVYVSGTRGRKAACAVLADMVRDYFTQPQQAPKGWESTK